MVFQIIQHTRRAHVAPRPVHVSDASEAPTVDAFISEWLDAQVHLRRGSRRAYLSRVQNHVSPLIGNMRVDDVSDGAMRAFVVALRKRVAPTTASNVLALVRAALDEACAQGFLPRNPARSLPRAMRSGLVTRPGRILSSVEIRSLLDAVDSDGWERSLFLTMLFAGLRSGEVRGLHWSDLDFRAGRIRVRRQAVGADVGPLKTPMSERDVVLHSCLSAQLREYADRHAGAGTDLIFPFNGRIMLSELLRNRLALAARRARLTDVVSHDLRRTFGSILIAAGADVCFVQRQLGHSSPSVTLRTYARLWDEQGNIERVASFLEEQFGRPSSAFLSHSLLMRG